jgi:hypothetical protein
LQKIGCDRIHPFTSITPDFQVSIAKDVANLLQQFEIKRGTKMVNFKDVKKRK